MYSKKRPWEYDVCKCGKKKQKKSKQCRRCANIATNEKRFGKINRYKCPICGGKKSRQSKQCMKCVEKSKWKRVMNKTLDEMMHHNSASRAIYNAVRKYARKYLEFKKIEKKCVVCAYSKDILDTSHFRDITDFPRDTKIQDINSLKNILYLCPRCHKELDKGIMEDEDLDKIIKYLEIQEHEAF